MPLPKMTKDHDRVILYKVKHSDIDPQKFVLFCRYFMIMSEYMRRVDYIRSLILIIDYRNTSLMDRLSKLNFSDLRDFFTIVMEGYGARVSQVHMISESKFFDFIIHVARQLVNPKIVSRIKIHGNIEALKEHIDTSILPVELGGTEKSMDYLRSRWYDTISDEKNVEYVKMMYKARTDESCRTGHQHNGDNMGTPGSFRNLKLD